MDRTERGAARISQRLDNGICRLQIRALSSPWGSMAAKPLQARNKESLRGCSLLVGATSLDTFVSFCDWQTAHPEEASAYMTRKNRVGGGSIVDSVLARKELSDPLAGILRESRAGVRRVAAETSDCSADHGNLLRVAAAPAAQAQVREHTKTRDPRQRTV